MLNAGRLAYGAALAVPPVLSRLAMLERYYRDRSVGLPARWTPAEAHDNAVANLPATVRAVAASLLDWQRCVGQVLRGRVPVR